MGQGGRAISGETYPRWVYYAQDQTVTGPMLLEMESILETFLPC